MQWLSAQFVPVGQSGTAGAPAAVAAPAPPAAPAAAPVALAVAELPLSSNIPGDADC